MPVAGSSAHSVWAPLPARLYCSYGGTRLVQCCWHWWPGPSSPPGSISCFALPGSSFDRTGWCRRLAHEFAARGHAPPVDAILLPPGRGAESAPIKLVQSSTLSRPLTARLGGEAETPAAPILNLDLDLAGAPTLVDPDPVANYIRRVVVRLEDQPRMQRRLPIKPLSVKSAGRADTEVVKRD